MDHLQTIESELRRVIAENDTEALVAWVKERIADSQQEVLRAACVILSAVGPPPVNARRGKAPSNLPV